MRRKGFTLIELLAVIVVLAVIALIATPMVLNTIDEAKKGSAIESVNAIVSTAETSYMSSMLTGTPVTRYDFPENDLDYKGTKPESGTLVIDDDGNTSITVKIDGYCIRKRFDETRPEVIDTKDCTIESSELESATAYKESILNGADPVVSDNLIPVKIASDGTVTKADTKQEWYNYNNKVWANAVILKDETISYENNETIPETNIESYFVWIPRYRYELFAAENYASVISSKPTESIAHPINIVFETKETSISDGTNNWLTHPAFTTFDTNGIWVGKYETGYDGATSTATAQVNSGDASKIIVKPNVYSWRSNTVSNMFVSSYNYNRTLDSHMMKNIEWGAVAYLSHSNYGINTEININNNSSYLTGYSAVEGTDQTAYPGTYGTAETVTLAYNTNTGYKASTTGNISGVYDMSGGSHEYMASYRANTLGSSGFTNESIQAYDSKYFDVYNENSTYTSYSNRILGDATGEMGPFYYYLDGDNNSRYHNGWYADNSYFVYSSNPWFLRGGSYYNGVLASQFYFSHGTGDAYSGIGSRLVLAV